MMKKNVTLVALFSLCSTMCIAQDFGPLSSLQTPLPGNLSEFVLNQEKAIALGKALFWDMQTGSDGLTACASCHFSGGGDTRATGQAHPGALGAFTNLGPNHTFTADDFPFRKLSDRDDAESSVLSDSTEVGGSAGVHLQDFIGLSLGATGAADSIDDCSNTDVDGFPIVDPLFNIADINVRQTTGRNAPSTINAIHYVDNFWDGRARSDFNGVNPGGQSDPGAAIRKVDADGNVVSCGITMEKASLASQSVGPPLSDVEMSGAGRGFIDLGKKMCSVTPLALQEVSESDSVLGDMAVASGDGLGLNTSYVDMIQQSFRPEYWNSDAIFDAAGNTILDAAGNPISGAPEGPDQFALMEMNFAMIWGISVMLYEATLVSDQTPFDEWLSGNEEALSPEAENGMDAFYSGGLKCAHCHSGPLLSAATWDQLNVDDKVGVGPVVNIQMNDGDGVADKGYFNVGLRPVAEDIGRAAVGDATWTSALAAGNNSMLPDSQIESIDNTDPVKNAGAFKTPTLRNVELNGPFFHNGSHATLKQVVEFYTRGGDFTHLEPESVHKYVNPIGKLRGKEPRQEAVVEFMKSLTDERVRWEMEPFDHPQLLIPNGAITNTDGSLGLGLLGLNDSNDALLELPAVGRLGRGSIGVPPVKGFLEDQSGNSNGTGTLGAGQPDVIEAICFETGDKVVLNWTVQGSVDSIIIEIDNGGIMGVETHVLDPAQTSFEDFEFRPGVTGYLLTPHFLGAELKSSACYIRRGAQPGLIPQFLRGDSNNDGILDLGDAVTSLDIIFFGLPAACNDASDWNDDGRVDISDPIATLGYIFGGTAAPEAPFPLCGTDPIFDSLDCTGASNCP
ncbi:MAG TPA: hypothetical protein DGU45_08905 [Planctomycetes bacterium]|nr:hypothetical protein [Planctomycetota bacterium]